MTRRRLRISQGLLARIEQLDYLYVLTYADLSAVNKNVWTEWKELLLLGFVQQEPRRVRKRNDERRDTGSKRRSLQKKNIRTSFGPLLLHFLRAMYPWASFTAFKHVISCRIHNRTKLQSTCTLFVNPIKYPYFFSSPAVVQM